MRLTKEQYAEVLKKRRKASALPISARPAEDRLALGRLKTGEMNKTEARYAEHLKKIQGTVIAWFKFEAIKLRLADNTFYSPDFAVMLTDGTLEMHEVKGFWEDDARVKIKVAAALYPFRFIGVMEIPRNKGGGWKIEKF